MKYLVYRSRLRDGQRASAVLADIARTSSVENSKRGISGVLFFTGMFFLQILEGNDKDIDQLFDNIQRDPRHDSVQLLHDTPISYRTLSDWNMEIVDLNSMGNLSEDQMKRVVDIVGSTMMLDTESFKLIITELLSEPEFRDLIA